MSSVYPAPGTIGDEEGKWEEAGAEVDADTKAQRTT